MSCTDCGKGCAKGMLILFNVIFLLTGAALFAVGLWVRFDDNVWKYIEFVSIDSDDRYIEYGAYLLIAVGAFILLTSIFGCCGAIKENKFCLGVYIFVLIVVLLAEIAGGVLVIIYQDEVKDKVTDELKMRFESNDTNYLREGKWSAFASSMNLVQAEFECCGLQGPNDYNTLDETFGVKTCTTHPCSCYRKTNNDKNADDLTAEDVDTADIYNEGCEDKVIDFFEQYSVIFIGLAIGFACIEIFGLIYAICLCQLADKSSKYME